MAEPGVGAYVSLSNIQRFSGNREYFSLKRVVKFGSMRFLHYFRKFHLDLLETLSSIM